MMRKPLRKIVILSARMSSSEVRWRTRPARRQVSHDQDTIGRPCGGQIGYRRCCRIYPQLKMIVPMIAD